MTHHEIDRRVIRELLRRSPTQSELATAIGATKQGTVTKSIGRLKSAGLVELTAAKDGRVKIPRLTIFAAVRKLEDSVRALVGATLAGAA
jgi:DNA-binding MarR family transcriptional regulator